MKGQGLSINFIVIAGLALLVLVIISYFVISGAQTVSKGTSNCEGKCTYDRVSCTNSGGTPMLKSKCIDNRGRELKPQKGKQIYCCLEI